MQNFVYYAPTKVVFGRGAEEQTGALVREQKCSRALVVYGSGSAVKSGLLARVLASLEGAGVAHAELGGVVPNPRLAKVYEGIKLAKEFGADFILAVGGGSVIDTCKAIGYGMVCDCDVWDFYCGKAVPAATYPVGSVLTIAAAGSEMSDSSVITNEESGLKRGCNSDVCRPRFAVMDPELTCTLPAYQTACGATDIMMHTMERYFTTETDLDLTDELAEGLMRRVKACALILKDHPRDYAARADLMWASSLSHNGLTGCGGVKDFACHQMEHELGGMFDVAHGAGLAAVWPTWARYVLHTKPERFARFAVRVMGAEPAADDLATAERGIRAVEDFYRTIGMPTTIRELGVELTDAQIDELSLKCSFLGTRKIGNFQKLDEADIKKIYTAARG